MFIEPMYACPLPNTLKNPKLKPFILEPGMYVAEEKYDGIRVVSEVSNTAATLFVEKGITAWSRYGNLKQHPKHIEEVLARLPNCIVDGERLAPGMRSYGSLDLDNRPDLIYYIFDILQCDGVDFTPMQYGPRRVVLSQILEDCEIGGPGCPVQLAPVFPANTWQEIYALRDEVWARDGEGLILKRLDSTYISGKRPKNSWIKIKQLQSDRFTVIGFEASRGEINNRGPYGMVRIIDSEGIETQVKTKNDKQCRLFEERAKIQPHPDLGRILWCEYQERTPDASYRHIRWDRWDNE